MTSTAEVEAPDPEEDPRAFIAGWDGRPGRPGLSKGVSRAALALAAALFSGPDGPPDAARLEWVAGELDDFFGHVTLRAKLLFSACVLSVSWLGPLFAGRLGTLGGLSVEERIAVLERIERTPLSLALLGAKAILSIVYFEHPDASRDIGWDQRCLGPGR